MNAQDLLAHLESLGVQLTGQDGRLRVSAAPGQLSDDLKSMIGEHKPQLLHLLARRSTALPEAAPDGEYPVSSAQRRLWFLDQLEPGQSAYTLGASHLLEAPVEARVLEQAINDVVRRQGSLRTVFRTVDGEPVQVVQPFEPVSLPLVDLSSLPPEEQDPAARRHVREEATQPFDLARGPLFRVMLLRVAAGRHLLLYSLHHIIGDGWSLGIFLDDLRRAYAARLANRPPALPPLAVHYGQHAIRERERLAGPALDRLLDHWRLRLAGAPPTLDLPTDRPRPPRRTFDGGAVPFRLAPELTDKLRGLARAERASVYMTLLAVFNVLLRRISGQTDIVVGTPVANRPTPELEGVIGMFVGTLPLRTDLGSDPGTRELIAQVRENVLDAQAHAELPFERLVDELRPQRSMAWSPIFQVVFALQNTPLASSFEVTTVAAMYDLSLFMWDEPQGIRGTFEYNTALFDRATVERMASHFVTLAEGMAAEPDRPVSRVPMLTTAQRAQVLVDWNDTARDYPRDMRLHALFRRAAALHCDAIALETTDPAHEILPVSRLTYAELDAASDRLAARLHERGVRAGHAVGLYAARTIGAVVGMLAIAKAGGAYVPLDSGDPPPRVAEVLRDAGVQVVLTQRSLAGRLPGGFDAMLLEEAGAAKNAPPSLPDEGSAEALAYVMFTSGTTGKPKGVCVTHRNVARLVCNPDYIDWRPGESVLQFAPLAFDASTLEIWGALLNGARLVVHPHNVPTASDLARVLVTHRIDTLWLTAGFFHYMVENEVEALAGVRQLLAGGDVLSVSHVQRLLDAKRDGVFVNGYGPTENTTFTCCHRMAPGERLGDTVPIGRPIANTRVYLLDAHGEPVPPGVAGELYTGGDGVSRGYLGNEAATGDKFLADPFDARPGATMYSTGDLARWRANGVIEFLGRRDRQVKVRGFRIEPQEVEDALRGCSGVRDAAVVARRDASGTNALVGYVVARGDAGIDLPAVKLALAERLPAYMVPSSFVMLPALPLTANGKLDRDALPEPQAAEPGRGVVEPRTLLQTQLHAIWERVLGRTGFGITDNFFDLGGHSMLAVRLFAHIERTFNVRLPVSALFAAPDIEQLAGRLEHEGFHSPWSSLVAIRPDGTQRALFLVPGVGGNVVCFSELARCLSGDQPLYALQSRGLDGSEAPFDRIEPMAAHYIAEIRKVQPTGPYRIGGTCFGGVVAYEMAQQLRRAGEEVEILFLLESWPPSKARPFVDMLRTHSTRLRFVAVSVKRNLKEMSRLPLRRLAGAIWSRLKIVGEIASKGDVYRGDAQAMYVDRVSLANQRALLHYRALPYDGMVRCAMATHRVFDGADLRRAWRVLAPRGYAQVELPSKDSGTMLMKPTVEPLADWMASALEETGRTPS